MIGFRNVGKRLTRNLVPSSRPIRAVKTWLDTILVIVSIPIACTGGVLALLITRHNFSVSAAMGFISIFGIAIQDAILVVTYFQRLRATEGHSIEQAAREASLTGMKWPPVKTMTSLDVGEPTSRLRLAEGE